MADPVPHEIRALADERARARRSRDWATADRLKAEIEAAGWRVVDAGTLSSLQRRPPSVVEVDGEVRYGASNAVPSRLAEPATAPATAVLVVGDEAGVLPASIVALQAHAPETQLVVVADAPSDEVAEELAALPATVEVVRLAPRLGAAAARNAGIRRATGLAVVLLSPRLVVESDVIAALVAGLDDPSVAVAGVLGMRTADLVHFEPAERGAGDVDAVDLTAMAFRRADYVERGPLDEHFTAEAYLDAWWSLVLRDVADEDLAGDDVAEGGAGAGDDTGEAPPESAAFAVVEPAPRRAVVVDAPHRLLGAEPAPPEERLAKKHRYRFLKAFATRRDLLVGSGR